MRAVECGLLNRCGCAGSLYELVGGLDQLASACAPFDELALRHVWSVRPGTSSRPLPPSPVEDDDDPARRGGEERGACWGDEDESIGLELDEGS